MSESNLEPIAPEEDARLYLRDKRTDLAEEAIEPYSYKLTRFIEWCEKENVDNLNDLSTSSRSPHAWRRGAITYHLTEDVPIEVVNDRINVSRDVLEAHYDRRGEEVKVEQRRAYLEGL